MSRAAPWRNKPSQGFQQLQAQLSQQNSGVCLYLLQRLGPASFVIGQMTEDEHAETKYKVTLCNVPSCTCMSHAAARCQELCVHLLFVLLRVFRLSSYNSLLWQAAWTDRELQQILDGSLSCSSHTSKSSSALNQGAGDCTSACSSVVRRPIDEDEPCPICYEPLSAVSEGWLVWCSNGCGRSIHGKCMRVWSDHQAKTLGQDITCPLCRCSWGPLNWRPPPTAISQSSTSRTVIADPHHRGVVCKCCRQCPIQGARYRCISCPAYNLCSSCFSAGQHLQHSFACQQTATAEETLASRSLTDGTGALQWGTCLQSRRDNQPRADQEAGGSHIPSSICRHIRFVNISSGSCKTHTVASLSKPAASNHMSTPAATSSSKGSGSCALIVSGGLLNPGQIQRQHCHSKQRSQQAQQQKLSVTAADNEDSHLQLVHMPLCHQHRERSASAPDSRQQRASSAAKPNTVDGADALQVLSVSGVRAVAKQAASTTPHAQDSGAVASQNNHRRGCKGQHVSLSTGHMCNNKDAAPAAGLQLQGNNAAAINRQGRTHSCSNARDLEMTNSQRKTYHADAEELAPMAAENLLMTGMACTKL